MKKEKLTYGEAGVDIEKGEKLSRWIKKKIAPTSSQQVLSEIGMFAGLYSLNKSTKSIYREPVLAATTDGVGTKLKIAHASNKHNTVGIDLVALSINDLLAQRAKPLFFLDYIATGKLSLKVEKEIISGIIEGCRRAQCTLLGGETAEMPSLYQGEEYDLAGFAVGILDKDSISKTSEITPGDRILGFPSSGLHSNGFSLVRKLFFEKKSYQLSDKIDVLNRTLQEELLEPSRIYTKPILYLLNKFKFKIKGIANITGGGLIRNIPRILPSGCQAHIYKKNWSPHPIFKLIQKEGNVDEQEMFKVFNMGIGMVIIVPDKEERPILASLSQQGEEAKTIGKVIRGKREVIISG